MAIFTNNSIDDYNQILVLINEFSIAMERPIAIDLNKLEAIIKGVYRDFPCKDGIENASIFKKAANFLCYFISERPIPNEFNKGDILDELIGFNNHQNVILGLYIVSSALKCAVINKTDGSGPILVKNSIKLSTHSYIDIVEVLSKNHSPSTSFQYITILLEQLVYKENPGAQYSDFITLA